MRNVLDKLPKRERSEAAKSLRAVYLSKTREEAKSKVMTLAKSWRGLYDRAAECLLDDLDRMFAYYDYPAEHHKHLRTTNPIESIFATVRLRTRATEAVEVSSVSGLSDLSDRAASGAGLATAESCGEVEVRQLAQPFDESDSTGRMKSREAISKDALNLLPQHLTRTLHKMIAGTHGAEHQKLCRIKWF